MIAGEAEDQEVYAAALAHAAGITRMEAGRQLDSLRRAGLLVPAGYVAGSGPGRPPAVFRRTDGLAWAGLMALGARFRRGGDELQVAPAPPRVLRPLAIDLARGWMPRASPGWKGRTD
jgi:hypothetical protein